MSCKDTNGACNDTSGSNGKIWLLHKYINGRSYHTGAFSVMTSCFTVTSHIYKTRSMLSAASSIPLMATQLLHFANIPLLNKDVWFSKDLVMVGSAVLYLEELANQHFATANIHGHLAFDVVKRVKLFSSGRSDNSVSLQGLSLSCTLSTALDLLDYNDFPIIWRRQLIARLQVLKS